MVATRDIQLIGRGARGASNYQLWLGLGNSGTVEDFINEQQIAGAQQVAAATAAAESAIVSASLAESITGPTYASQSAGQAATTAGQSFAVDNGDGTVSIYLRTSGGSTLQRTLATTAALAAAGGAKKIGYKKSGVAGNVLIDLDKLNSNRFHLYEFGWKADSNISGTTGTNNSPAFTAAIQAANDAGGGTIIFPFDGTGYARYDTPVWDGPLVSGIRFTSDGRGPGHRYDRKGLLNVYTGDDSPMWNIYQAEGDYGSSGEWEWDGLGFYATKAGGDLFGFNLPSTINEETESDRGILSGAVFRRCAFYGAEIDLGGGLYSSGDGIRAKNLFFLHVDRNCTFRGFRRAIHGYGCDHGYAAGYYRNNGRGIMLEKFATAGNAFEFAPNASVTLINCGEDMFHIHDSANQTLIRRLILEEGGPVEQHPTASVYLNGVGFHAEWLSTNGIVPAYHLGPDAEGVIGWYEGGLIKPIYDPVPLNFGEPQLRKYVTIMASNPRAAPGLDPHHPRQRGPAVALAGGQCPVEFDPKNIIADANGARPKSYFIYAGNYNGIAREGSTPPGYVADAAASTGWAIQFAPGATRGMFYDFLPGKHFALADVSIKVTIRSRVVGTIVGGGYLVTNLRDTDGTPNVGNYQHTSGNQSGTYRIDTFTTSLSSGVTSGSDLQLVLNSGDLNVPINVDWVLVEVIGP